MNTTRSKEYKSHGDGSFVKERFRSLGKNVIFEAGSLVFHEDTISIGDNVYIGHLTILKGYFNSSMAIGSDTWIGQGCFLHSGGGLEIGQAVGIGPGVKIITSSHEHHTADLPVIHHPLVFKKVTIGHGADIGIGAIILPGASIGEGAIVGAGAVVTKDVPPYTIVAGSPAQKINIRQK